MFSSSKALDRKMLRNLGTDVPKCAGCGCRLEPYEVFAGRIRGLDLPVCLGCAYKALVWLRGDLLPLLDKFLADLGALAEGEG